MCIPNNHNVVCLIILFTYFLITPKYGEDVPRYPRPAYDEVNWQIPLLHLDNENGRFEERLVCLLVVSYKSYKGKFNKYSFNIDGCASLLYRASNVKKPRQRTN